MFNLLLLELPILREKENKLSEFWSYIVTTRHLASDLPPSKTERP